MYSQNPRPSLPLPSQDPTQAYRSELALSSLPGHVLTGKWMLFSLSVYIQQVLQQTVWTFFNSVTLTLSYSSEGSRCSDTINSSYKSVPGSPEPVFLYQETRPQNAFIAFSVLLPSASNSAEWSGRVWYLPISMAFWRTFVNLKPTKWPLLSAEGCNTLHSKFKFNKKCAKRPKLIAEGCQLSHLTGWAALPSENISRHPFQGGETLWRYK